MCNQNSWHPDKLWHIKCPMPANGALKTIQSNGHLSFQIVLFFACTTNVFLTVLTWVLQQQQNTIKWDIKWPATLVWWRVRLFIGWVHSMHPRVINVMKQHYSYVSPLWYELLLNSNISFLHVMNKNWI